MLAWAAFAADRREGVGRCRLHPRGYLAKFRMIHSASRYQPGYRARSGTD
jgi:hypothetical protein